MATSAQPSSKEYPRLESRHLAWALANPGAIRYRVEHSPANFSVFMEVSQVKKRSLPGSDADPSVDTVRHVHQAP